MFALLALALFSPIILVVSLWLYLAQDGEIFFIQDRPGRGGKIFKIVKFKTMKDVYDKNGIALPDVARLTNIGRRVRALSLDELPQLWNVLIGEMSLVGPRPLLVEYLALYDREQARRHEVRPGITGWAQVNGRNALTWEERFRYDVWYVDNRSVSLYGKILWMTVVKVLRREGINQPGSATAEKFTGMKDES